MRHDLTFSVVIVAFLLAIGCGDDAAPADAGGDAARQDSPGTGAELVVRAMLVTPVTEDTQPAAGVAVAVDRPGGGRVETMTGSDGRARFDGIDWFAGTASVIAYLEGHTLFARLGLDGDEGEVVVYMRPFPEATTQIVLSGTVAGKMVADNTLTVGSTAGGSDSVSGSSFMFDTPADTAATIFACELSSSLSTSGRGYENTFVQWTTLDHAGASADSMVALDFATPATPTIVTGSVLLPMPRRSASVLDETEFALLAGPGLNTITRIAISTDGTRLEYDAEFLQLPALERPVTTYYMYKSPEVSWIDVPGWPAGGALDVGFADPPTVATPAFGVDAHWSDTIEWETESTDLPGVLVVTSPADDRILVLAYREPGRSALALPVPPTGTTPTDALGGASGADARVQVCDVGDWSAPSLCDRGARSRAFGLVP